MRTTRTLLFLFTLLPALSWAQGPTLLPYRANSKRPSSNGTTMMYRDSSTGKLMNVSRFGQVEFMPIDTGSLGAQWVQKFVAERTYQLNQFNVFRQASNGLYRGKNDPFTILQIPGLRDTLNQYATNARVNQIVGSGGDASTTAFPKNVSDDRYAGRTVTQTALDNRTMRASLAQLRADASSAPAPFIYVTDAGREGTYYLDAFDTTSPDNGGTVLRTSGGKVYKRPIGETVTVTMFGAKGDGVADDGPAIVAALSSGAGTVVFPKTTSGTYRFTNLLALSGLSRKKIIATGVKILQSDTTKAGFLFSDCNNIEIEGGEWGLAQAVHQNGNQNQHILQFVRSQNVSLSRVSLLRSSEMGVAFTVCNYVSVTNSTIAYTFRDGIYCRYSANVSLVGNTIHDNKDDAISFHDKDNPNSGVDAEKSLLNQYGYAQASYAIIERNTIYNSYQGVGSVHAAYLTIRGNNIKNTVIAGIAVYNAKVYDGDPTANVQKVLLESNTIDSTNRTTVINGISYPNNGQSGTGRAAIFVGSLGTNMQVGMGETRVLMGITLKNNIVRNSGANGLWTNLIVGLTLDNNTIQDCSGVNSSAGLAGIPVELNGTTGLLASVNYINDTRATPQHVRGYQATVVSGTLGKWVVRGVTAGDKALNTVTATPEPGGTNVINDGAFQAMNLPTGFYTLKNAVTGMPSNGTNWLVTVVHDENDAGGGGGTWWRCIAMEQFNPQLVYSGGRDGSGNWLGWKQVMLGPVGTPATGALLYWNGSTWATLAPGSNGQFLKMVSNLPAWSN